MINISLGELEPRLMRRIGEMQAKGALDEIILAWKKCPDKSAPAWSGIGCRESLAYLQGRLKWEEWRNLWFANTRAYAKRQLTWFRGRSYALPIGAGDVEAILSFLQD